MDQIRSGVAGEDYQEAEWGAHSLKSSAANIGAEGLRTLATNVESAALDKDISTLRELLPKIEASYSLVMDALRALEKEMPNES